MDIQIGKDISPQLFSFHEQWLQSGDEPIKKLYTTLHHMTRLP